MSEAFYVGKLAARVDELNLGARMVAFEPYVGERGGELEDFLLRFKDDGSVAAQVTARGTWLYPRGVIGEELVHFLDHALDTSGGVDRGTEIVHWIAGTAFGYDMREIERYIAERGKTREATT